MTSITYWTRIEPRPRSEDFQRGLTAEIRDPLWFLTRQWQFGEFLASEFGSMIHAEIKWSHTKLKKFRAQHNPKIVGLDGIPLEPTVEHEKISTSLKLRAQLGQNFERMLRGRYDNYIIELRKKYPLDLYTGSDQNTVRYFEFIKGKVIDGFKLKSELEESLKTLAKLPQKILDVIDIADKDSILKEVNKFFEWSQKTYYEPSPDHPSCWKDERLEYGFYTSAPSFDGTETVLSSPEYSEGSLDWYSFSFDPKVNLDSTMTLEENQKTTTFLPANIKFKGMPNSRWWDFEDENIIFGAIETDKRDIAKLLVMNFALTSSNDWFMIPLSIPVGAIARIDSLIVTDVFGERILIKPSDISFNDPKGWSMFRLSQIGAPENPKNVSDFLLLAPSLGPYLEGESLEQVNFIRDEMANMAWAIEQVYEGEIGQPVSGYESSIKNSQPINTPQDIPKYILQTDVPINWIPLIPIRASNSNRSIDLQRGSLLESESGISNRPKSKIMNPENITQYKIKEEEIPREGVIVTRSFQLARWIDGSTYLWVGRRKRTGRGEGSSGLRFDVLKDKQT